ncbi:GYF_domain [Hexamita inflata]|uniref:GYF domain n=1 Tax=Hexamita inflata TaxID=28002 RepID=A0AA86QQG2_9EUKA|nr:GYF domain [Hexamita inflata]CAI9962713.1 GYF domain [Hexamita inflata]CAI9962715.1 GYF domain [Hexamita inflata]
MSRNNLEEQNDDVEQLNPKIQINPEKPAEANSLDLNVEIIAAQVTGQISTKQDSPKIENDAQTQLNDNPEEIQVDQQNDSQSDQKQDEQNYQQTQNIFNTNSESKHNQEPKENDSEPETQINQKENKQEYIHPKNENDWYYIDIHDQVQGPFSTKQMNKWNSKGELFENMIIQRGDFKFKLQKEQKYLPFLFKDQKDKVEKELDLKIEKKHEDEKKNEGEKLIAVEVGTNAQTKQNVTKKDPLIQMKQHIQKNENIPKETQDVENPEAENNVAGKPKMNKTDLFGDDFYNQDLTYVPVKSNQQQQGNHQTQENNNAETMPNAQTSAYSYSTHYEKQQQLSQQIVNGQENKSISYYPIDESQSESQQQSMEEFTSPPTDSKKWSESQWAVYKDAVFEAIKKYFNIEFDTLKDALIYHRIQTVGGVKQEGNKYVLDETIMPTKVPLNFEQIAIKCGSTENKCYKQLVTLQDNEFDDWPEKEVDMIVARINELWEKIQEHDIVQKKKIIRKTIGSEFHLNQQVQYRDKQIKNKINYVLGKLQ